MQSACTLFLLFVFYLFPHTAFGGDSSFNTLYTTEFLLDYDASESAWVIDRFGDVAGDLELRFGNIPTQSIKFDVANNWFSFGSSIDLGQNEIKNAALDRRISAPLSPVVGQIYYNLTDLQTYVWNGTQWTNLSSAGHTQNTDTGTTADSFTVDQDNSSGNPTLAFGAATGNSIRWDIANDRFVVNDNLRIEGSQGVVGQTYIANDHNAANSPGVLNLGRLGSIWQTIGFNTASGLFETSRGLSVGGNIQQNGTSLTLDADNAGTGQDVTIIANQGSESPGILRYNTTLNRWELSNNGGAFTALGAAGPTGPQGPAGPTGPQGSPGLTTLFAQTPATLSACPAGGFVFTSGLDSNQNSVLDSGEVASTATICNGTNGSGGTGGGTLVGNCSITQTASYSNSGQYAVALSGFSSYANLTLAVTWNRPENINNIGNSNGGTSSYNPPLYSLSLINNAQSVNLFVNYVGTPSPGQRPSVSTATISQGGQSLSCSVN